MLLTPRQQQVVDFLRDYAAREGMPPTQAEIASRFGFTQKAAGDHRSEERRVGKECSTRWCAYH